MNTIYNLDKYRTEGKEANETGKPRCANPYDYRFETLAANAWDEGYDAAEGMITIKLPFSL